MLCSLDDRSAIDDLLARYAFALDLRQWDELRQVFAEDATLDYSTETNVVHSGIDEIIEYISTALSRRPGSQHLIHTTQVWSTGPDSASGRTHATAQHLAPGSTPPVSLAEVYSVGCTYTDEFVRTPDGWRISRRKLMILYHGNLA